ncbi:hypothetical protein ACFU3O_14735 [Streptomyces antibioticus]|uniref:hypothetical protein n=1 Tax=Streptomyces antibioticus TaxID=1890 RepID=UPI003683542E
MDVGVIVLPRCWDSGLTTVLDVLRAADGLRRQVDRGIPVLRPVTVAAQGAVRTAGDLVVAPDLLLSDRAGVSDLDVLVMPATVPQDPVGVLSTLACHDVQRLLTVLRHWALEERQLATARTGTFVLADLFRRRYPRTTLDMDRMVVRDGPVTTAGAAFAHIDLALHLDSRVSPLPARFTAATLLVDERPARSTHAVQDHLRSADALVMEFEGRIRATMERDISVGDAAAALSTTRRTPERRVRGSLGMSPKALIRRLRTERSHHLERTTRLTSVPPNARLGRQPAKAKSAPALRRSGAPGPCHLG